MFDPPIECCKTVFGLGFVVLCSAKKRFVLSDSGCQRMSDFFAKKNPIDSGQKQDSSTRPH